jgi:hydroxypyruvate reductase
MLDAGATITEINTVRRHMSRIKGGGLTRAVAPARTFAILTSDVIGGAPNDIGSGPTMPDPTTVEDARKVLLLHAKKYRGLPLRESLKPGDPAAPLQRTRIAAVPQDFADTVAQELAAAGVEPTMLEGVIANANTLAAEYEKLSKDLAPGQAFVRASEPVLKIPHDAPNGGRSGHLAALLAPRLPKDVFFLAGATDGLDGTSGKGGAVVDRTFLDRVGEKEYRSALAAFDSARLHEAAGTALPGGATSLNFADVHVLVRAR